VRQSKEPSCSVSIKRAVCPIQRALHPISLCSFELQVSFSNYRSLFQITGLFCKSRLSYTKSPTSYITLLVWIAGLFFKLQVSFSNYRSLLQKPSVLYKEPYILYHCVCVCVCVCLMCVLHVTEVVCECVSLYGKLQVSFAKEPKNIRCRALCMCVCVILYHFALNQKSCMSYEKRTYSVCVCLRGWYVSVCASWRRAVLQCVVAVCCSHVYLHSTTIPQHICQYRVATISRLLKMIGLFCRISSRL